MTRFVEDIEELTQENKDYRRVLYTGKHLQLVLMSLKAGEETGEDVHVDHDQFFRVEKGKGELVLEGDRVKINRGDAVIVPAGARHNVINTGEKSMKLFMIYGPPHDPEVIVSLGQCDLKTAETDGESTQ
jgi:mannose-6-phosphate isomerase-like protein (cupin superfamily)